VRRGQKVVDEGGLPFYALNMPADDPSTLEIEGERPGDTITFQIDGMQAVQTAIWQGGGNMRVDLTIADQ
jgi:hypothetical protein